MRTWWRISGLPKRMRWRRSIPWLLVLCPGLLGAAGSEDVAFFENKIRPLLAQHCYECHSARAKEVRGGLLLDSRVGVRKGGDSGAVLVPGQRLRPRTQRRRHLQRLQQISWSSVAAAKQFDNF